MTALQTFTFAGTRNVRTVNEDGQIKFVARDICNALGIGNPAETFQGPAEDERGMDLSLSTGAATLRSPQGEGRATIEPLETLLQQLQPSLPGPCRLPPHRQSRRRLRPWCGSR